MMVDDDELDLFATTQQLISGGICSQVATCGSARMALEKLQKLETPPALLLLDLSMPQLNGLDFLFHYGQLPADKTLGTSIVLLTGYAAYKPYLVNKALQYHNVVGYIEKPLLPAELFELVGQRQAAV